MYSGEEDDEEDEDDVEGGTKRAAEDEDDDDDEVRLRFFVLAEPVRPAKCDVANVVVFIRTWRPRSRKRTMMIDALTLPADQLSVPSLWRGGAED